MRPGLPFIFVSGTLGEEVAIDALKIGATDYVLKSRLEARAVGKAGAARGRRQGSTRAGRGGAAAERDVSRGGAGIEPHRQLLTGYRQRFGNGFYQRAQEAIKCRNAEAWLACCAMTGAAAESVLLALAIAKTDDEAHVLRTYRQSNGRQRVLNLIVGQVPQPRRDTLTIFSNIISMWRDEAAHGQVTLLGTANADEALRQLLHMCQWVEREWVTLTT
jgi:hypothetical protein